MSNFSAYLRLHIAAPLISLAAGALLAPAVALAAPLEVGVWLNDSGEGAVEVYPCGRNLCGRIVWLKDPLNAQGVPKRDRNNPSASQQNRPICGLPVLGNLGRVEDGYDSGWIYDPKTGKTYSAYIRAGQTQLRVTGYLSMRMLGKSFTWTRAPANLGRCGTQPPAAQTVKDTPKAPPAATKPTTAAANPPAATPVTKDATATAVVAPAPKAAEIKPATVAAPAATPAAVPVEAKAAPAASSAAGAAIASKAPDQVVVTVTAPPASVEANAVTGGAGLGQAAPAAPPATAPSATAAEPVAAPPDAGAPAPTKAAAATVETAPLTNHQKEAATVTTTQQRAPTAAQRAAEASPTPIGKQGVSYPPAPQPAVRKRATPDATREQRTAEEVPPAGGDPYGSYGFSWVPGYAASGPFAERSSVGGPRQ